MYNVQKNVFPPEIILKVSSFPISTLTPFSTYLAGKDRFLRNLIGSSISEHPALFTFEQNKMASHFVWNQASQAMPNKQRNLAIKYSKICTSFTCNF